MNAVVTRLHVATPVHVSVVIPVVGRHDDIETVYRAYAGALRAAGHPFDMIYVLDGREPAIAATLQMLQGQGEPIHFARFGRQFGEAACLREGVQRATGDIVLFLPAYFQIAPEAIPLVLARMDGADLVSARRDRAGDGSWNRLRGWGFRRLARIAGSRFEDPGCVIRAVRREVLNEIPLQDEQHRFLPLLAEQHGFVVEQIAVPQARSDQRFRNHRASVYVGVTLDIIAISFLLRFIQKPFRFFGTSGAIATVLGIALGLSMLIQRTFDGRPLADRPMLILAVLLVVLGIQLGAIGLIAEIIIFTRSPQTRSYRIATIVERPAEEHATG